MLKTNLQLALLTAIRYDPEIKAYYDRKELDEKFKMRVTYVVGLNLFLL